jgi:hypothetical protein
VTENLDKELERLSDLVSDFREGTPRWEILWARIDRLLEERGTLAVEVHIEHNNSL